MAIQIELIEGPPTKSFSRTAAEQALVRHPDFPKGASFTLSAVGQGADERWIAAFAVESAPPFGAPADDDEESAGPKSEGPDDTAPADDGPPSPDGPPSDDGGEPPKDKGEKGDKGGDKALLHQLLEGLTQIGEALGVPIGLGDSPVPGPDDPLGAGGPPVPPPPHAPGPPGLGGPGGPPGAEKSIHERALKPGEVPPGGTPIGAPAFAKVSPDHPWAHIAGKVASFEVSERIGDEPLPKIHDELQNLARTAGYKVHRFGENVDDEGYRVAFATISAH